MTVASTLRRAGPYTGNGVTTEFAFSFKIFEDSELIVARSSDNGEETLVLNTDYAVSLNANQDISPGGKVVLKKALAEGIRLAIISNVPYNQLAVFTNKGGFYPETLNEVDDKQTILSQQLLEKVERAIVTDPTDSMTPQELKNKLLDAANDATVIAKGYAEAAAASATDAKKSAEGAAGVENRINAKEASLGEGLEQISNDERSKIIAEVDRQVGRVTARGDLEVDRLNRAGEIVLDRSGIRCKAGTRTFDAAIAAGAEVTLPAEISYVVAAKHLRLVWNGLVLYPGEQYTEVGAEFTESTTVKLTFDLKAGDVLQAWVVPLGGTKDSETGVITPDESKKCAVETWTISGVSVAPVVLRLPNDMTYVAGKDHLRVSWNGLVLMPPYEYEEVGEVGAPSNQIKINIDLSVGDVLNAWTVPYAAGEPSETQQQIAVLQDALAELSRKVVYKDAQ